MHGIQFLNVDLDIESGEDISILVREIGARSIIMRDEMIDEIHYASFETILTSENEIVAEYNSIISNLTESARELWARCRKRSFNFGYESGESPNDFHSVLSGQTVSNICKMGGEIVVTIYPINDENT